MNILESSITAGHCQRNWDTKPIPEDDIKTITDVALNMPTKQNVLQYEIIAITNREVIEYLYSIAVSVASDAPPGGAIFKGNEIYRNGQVNASLLLIWITSTNPKQWVNVASKDKSNIDHYSKCIGVGISAGATALAANQLGYRTGFNQCYDQTKMKQFITDNTEYGDNFMTSLGIGYPLEGYSRNQTVKEGTDGTRRVVFTSQLMASEKLKLATFI